MSLTFSQANNATFTGGGASSFTCAYTSSNIAGNLLVAIGTGSTSVTSFSVSDSQGNTWVQIGTLETGVISKASIFVCYNAIAGANTVTLTYSPGNTNLNLGLLIGEWTNSAAAGSLSADGAVQGHAPSPQTSEVLSGLGNAAGSKVIWACNAPNGKSDTISGNNGCTVQASPTVSINGAFCVFADKVGTGNDSGGINTSGGRDWVGFMFGVKTSASGVPNSLMMMGCGT